MKNTCRACEQLGNKTRPLFRISGAFDGNNEYMCEECINKVYTELEKLLKSDFDFDAESNQESPEVKRLRQLVNITSHYELFYVTPLVEREAKIKRNLNKDDLAKIKEGIDNAKEETNEL